MQHLLTIVLTKQRLKALIIGLALLLPVSTNLLASPLLEIMPKSEQQIPQIIIIIDDLGDNLQAGLRTTRLPGEVTVAILPHTPNATTLAKEAHRHNKEVMLHMPMSNLHKRALGPGGLTPEMSQQQFLYTLRSALNAIPHLKGINNHMGSELTQLPPQMRWVMQELSCRDLYFVDSRTSPNSVAYQTAKQQDIAHLRRDVFLDHHREPEKIAAAFQQLLHVARKRGLAIGIGHPYPETLKELEKSIPKLATQGIALVKPSDILRPGGSLAQARLQRLQMTAKQPSPTSKQLAKL
jgi:hypothetical protein